jgi:HSP20 family protein
MRTLIPYWTTRRGSASDFMSSFTNEMNRLFSDFERMPSSVVYEDRGFSPACEVAEADGHYLLSLDIPGMKREDIKIEVNENILTISGERKRESKSDEKDKFQRYEKAYGFFKRSFSLPVTIEAGKVEAHYQDGVLELCLPKAPTAKAYRVEVQSGRGGFFEKLLGSQKESTGEFNEVKPIH